MVQETLSFSEGVVNKMRGVTKSKTMWFSGLLVVFGILEMKLPEVRELIPPVYYGVSNVLIGVITALLRWVTTTSLEEK